MLAGGRSQRMGQNKAWLPLGGRPVLGRVVQAGLDAETEVVVVGSPGVALPELAPTVVRVDDPAERSFEGPLSGLVEGLGEARRRGLEVVAVTSCDNPWLSAAHLRFVLEALRVEPTTRAVVPFSREEGREILHPLSGALRTTDALVTARALLGSGQRAARALVQALGARRIDAATLPDARVLHGCNTPEQWSRAARAWQAEHLADPAVE